ncbi:MAG: hypothetical protein ABIP38_11040 [Steroidobacteraceae bacterium]
MTEPKSPFQVAPPSARTLLATIAAALVGALIILVVAVLPAEYGIDLTGLGRAMGLTAINGPTRKLAIPDVIGGNEKIREVTVPDAGEPIPLPNPAVIQLKKVDAQTRTMNVVLKAGEETEIKAILDAAQVILYSWKSDGEVYTDFHGHDPSLGQGFVRYEEQQAGHEGHGSLVAPFSGEHGWYWLSLSDKTVTITLTVTGYFNGIKDYGIIGVGAGK